MLWLKLPIFCSGDQIMLQKTQFKKPHPRAHIGMLLLEYFLPSLFRK